MGGMNLAVRNITGKDPDAYLSDYRNRNNMKMQELKEAVGVESRTTILNPTYIKEKNERRCFCSKRGCPDCNQYVWLERDETCRYRQGTFGIIYMMYMSKTNTN